jgi:hypothetical protein
VRAAAREHHVVDVDRVGEDAAEAMAYMKAGKPIYAGPVKDNKGKVVLEKA